MIVEPLRLMIRKSPPLVSLRKHFKGRPVQYQTFILGSLFGVRFCSKLHTQSWARSDWKGKNRGTFLALVSGSAGSCSSERVI